MRKLLNVRLGISVKLFVALWLVIVISVFTTRFISEQINGMFDHGKADQQQLTTLKTHLKKIKEKGTDSPRKIQLIFKKKTGQHLILQDLDNEKVYLPPGRHWHRLKHYLKRNVLTNPTNMALRFSKVTGPVVFKTKKRDFLAFIATKEEKPSFSSMVYHLPSWVQLILVITISFFLCWLLAKTLIGPLLKIQQATVELGKGKLNTRITDVSRNDEIGDLANNFNQMASRIENNVQAHQRLLGDVSHELRSPLTRLQLAIGLAEKNKLSTNKLSEHLNRCEHEVDQLDNMLGDILLLSKLEHAFESPKFETVNLSSLLETTVSDCQYLANKKGCNIVFKSTNACLVDGNINLLQSALSNILNNAIKYTDDGSTIIASLTCDETQVICQIADQGIGVPEEQLNNLFDPFYRVDEARDRDSGGIGLGLAIAKQAIERHHGKLSANNNSDGGLTITITLNSYDVKA